MRNLLFSACFLIGLIFCQEANAQYKFFTGGQLYFTSQSVTDSDVVDNSYTIAPYIGYSVSDNIIVGLALGYSGSKTGLDSDNYGTLNSFVINPFTRYRVAANDKTGIYGELGARIDLGNEKLFVNNSEFGDPTKTTDLGIYLGPGIDYAFAERWVINALWGAVRFDTETAEDSDINTNDFTIDLNPANIRFSLNYLF